MDRINLKKFRFFWNCASSFLQHHEQKLADYPGNRVTLLRGAQRNLADTEFSKALELLVLTLMTL